MNELNEKEDLQVCKGKIQKREVPTRVLYLEKRVFYSEPLEDVAALFLVHPIGVTLDLQITQVHPL